MTVRIPRAEGSPGLFAPDHIGELQGALHRRPWLGNSLQARDGRRQSETLTVRSGSLELRTLACDVPDGAAVSKVAVSVTGTKVASTFEQDGRRVRIALKQEVSLDPGLDLLAELEWHER